MNILLGVEEGIRSEGGSTESSLKRPVFVYSINMYSEQPLHAKRTFHNGIVQVKKPRQVGGDDIYANIPDLDSGTINIYVS